MYTSSGEGSITPTCVNSRNMIHSDTGQLKLSVLSVVGVTAALPTDWPISNCQNYYVYVVVSSRSESSCVWWRSYSTWLQVAAVCQSVDELCVGQVWTWPRTKTEVCASKSDLCDFWHNFTKTSLVIDNFWQTRSWSYCLLVMSRKFGTNCVVAIATIASLQNRMLVYSKFRESSSSATLLS